MNAQDVYIRLVDPSGAHKPTVSYHRVWDRAAFLDARRHDYEVKAKDNDVRHVEVATEADYRKFMNYKGY